MKKIITTPPTRTTILNSAKRVVVKIGSAVLTTDEGLNRAVIARLVDAVASLRTAGREVILVSSGAIAAGFKKIGLATRPQGIPQKQAVAAIGQSTLMQTYEAAFGRHGLKVAQLLLTKDDLAHRRRYLNARNTLFTLLDWGVIPVINENDTVAVEEIRFGDNDTLSALISSLVQAQLLVILTDIDGLYDHDPRNCPDACLISRVDRIDARLERAASGQAGTLGTGGMLSKLQAAKKAGAAGIPTIIANGRTPDILPRLFAGDKVGTLVVPHQPRLTSRQYWIAYNQTPRGEIIVDDGAREVLLHQGKSLLPAGIVGVKGRFGMGAPVRLVDTVGRVFGIGLSNYSAADIACIKGLQTCNIESSLGVKGYDEVIHRDNLVVFTDSREADEP